MKKVMVAILIGISTITIIGCGNKDKGGETKIDKETEINEENKDKENEKVENTENEKEVKVEEKEFKLYLFDKENLKEEVVKQKVKIEDKAIVKGLTEILKSENLDKKYLKLPKEVEVKEAKVRDEILTVNFSKNFIKDMPLGTATESGLIYMLINTYGHGVNVQKVRIELNGELYVGLGDEVSKKGYFEISEK
ncbi:MAG: GerMN domain-containing protein [Clostridium sp.]|uniref:GerMN domain-containing protein n=1 Tax=Clostridium sp. TaxID=1506 RepID=UPI003F2FF579